MSNNSFYDRKWKYVSIGLMAVLAVGFSFPQASAHVTNNVQHMLEHIFNTTNDTNEKVTDIQAKVNDPDFGLQEIKTEVQAINEGMVDRLEVVALGHEGDANPGNSVSALILVRVTLNGQGVAGLTVDDFALHTHLVPAGECALEIDEFNIFGVPGDYALRVTPIDACETWEAGDYDSTVIVTSGDLEGSTLVKITVT